MGVSRKNDSLFTGSNYQSKETLVFSLIVLINLLKSTATVAIQDANQLVKE